MRICIGFALVALYFVYRAVSFSHETERSPTLEDVKAASAAHSAAMAEIAATEEGPGAPQTLEGAMSANPALRQIVELYFGREISRLTLEDLAAIQFLALEGEKAYLSDEPLRAPTIFESVADWPEATAIAYDTPWQDGAALDNLAGLKTLSLQGVNGDVSGLPAMERLERLTIYSGADTVDFVDFQRFAGLKELAVSGGSLTSYAGLSQLAGLERLGLYATGLTDLGVLSEMTQLRALALSRNGDMPGIVTLEKMTWLTELTVHDVEYTDLNMIGSLTNLEWLVIAETQVKSLSFLSNLTNLRALRLTDNDAALAIPPLSVMTRLEEIVIDCGATEDVSYLNGLSGVKRAELYGIDSLEPLRDFTSMHTLQLELGWLLEDLSPLGALTGLEQLRLGGGTHNEPRGIEALGNLTNLTTLDMNGADNYFLIDFIANLTKLERLDLSNNTLFGNFAGIGNLSGLRELYLSDVTVYDDYEMTNNAGMVDIYFIGDHSLDDFAGELAKLTKLEVLRINDNEERLSTLDFAANMPALRALEASGNYITDVSPLAGLDSLEYADLSGNAVEDWSVLDNLIDTKIIR
jgi:Leucine-rich repeat (LRR) protein